MSDDLVYYGTDEHIEDLIASIERRDARIRELVDAIRKHRDALSRDAGDYTKEDRLLWSHLWPVGEGSVQA